MSWQNAASSKGNSQLEGRNAMYFQQVNWANLPNLFNLPSLPKGVASVSGQF